MDSFDEEVIRGTNRLGVGYARWDAGTTTRSTGGHSRSGTWRGSNRQVVRTLRRSGGRSVDGTICDGGRQVMTGERKGFYAQLAVPVQFHPDSRHPVTRPAGTIVRCYTTRASTTVEIHDTWIGQKLRATVPRETIKGL